MVRAVESSTSILLKNVAVGVLIGAAGAGALFLGLNISDIVHHGAAFGTVTAATIASGILGLFLAKKWVPGVDQACHRLICSLQKTLGLSRNIQVIYVDPSGKPIQVQTDRLRLTNIQRNAEGEDEYHEFHRD